MVVVLNPSQGGCKYYISTLGGGGGSEGNAYQRQDAYIAYVKDQNSYSPENDFLSLRNII